MDNRVKNILKYLISLALAAMLLYVCFRDVDWTEFGAALAACRWGWVLASMAAGALAFLLRGLRWRMLLTPTDPSTGLRSCFNAVNISYVANMLFPRLGELVRCGYITRSSARDPEGKRLASYDKVLGTVVLERSWDALTLVMVFLVTMALTWHRFGSFFSENILAVFRLPWMLPVLLLAAAALVCVIWLLRKRFGFFSAVARFIRGIWQGLLNCLHMEKGWLFILLTAGIWLCYWLMAATVIWSLRGTAQDAGGVLASMGMTDALFLMVVGSVSSLVPVPGGFGAYHYLLSLALQSVYGIPLATGLVFATLSHESQALTQLICGALSWIDETWVRKDLSL